MLEAPFRGRKQHQIRKRQTADPLISKSDTLFDSAVIVYLIHINYEEW